MHYVYIIKSVSRGVFYKGYTLFPLKRLTYHNANKSRYTSGKGPWELVYIQSYGTKTEALRREKRLKKYAKNQIEELIVSRLNELDRL